MTTMKRTRRQPGHSAQSAVALSTTFLNACNETGFCSIKLPMHTHLFSPLGPRPLLSSLALIFYLSTLALPQDRPSHLPDPKLTPGETIDVTRDTLCGDGRAALDDDVSIKMKSRVFDIYGIKPDTPGSYNVDHLIPADLGGATTIKNLWPQPLAGDWGYVQKNKLERRLRRMVCSGELDLKKAQEEIAGDWVEAYKRYVTGPR